MSGPGDAGIRRLAFGTAAERERNAASVAEHLRSGGLVAYPTETVYGFGCALRRDALAALAALKSREGVKPFLLLVGDARELSGVAWTESGRRLAAAVWPGPLTLALQAEEGAYPAGVLSPGGTVAVRVSPHPAVQAILHSLPRPLTSTSANLPGASPARDAEEVAAVLRALGRAESVLVVDGGRLPPSAPSTLVDCSREPPRVLRLGALPLEALRGAVPEIDEPS